MKINPKNPFLPRLRKACVASVTALYGWSASQAGAVSVYWDIDGDTPGAGGAAASGSWDAANWSLSSAGDTTTSEWISGDVAVFSAGTDAAGAYLVSLSSTRVIAGLTVEEGSPVIAGSGTLQLSGAEPLFSVAGESTLSVSTGLSGEGVLAVGGEGTLVLDGSGSFSGSIRTNANKLILAGSYPELSELTFSWNDSSEFQNLDIVEGADVTVKRLVLADLYYTENTVSHSGGTLNISGTNDSNSTLASFLIGHWGYGTTCVYGLSGGTLNSIGARLSLGWDRPDVAFNQSGGTANLLGINLDNGRGNPAAYNLTGGRLNLGSGGINNQASKSMNVGNATLGAFSNWTSSKPLTFTGGTVTVETLDAIDETTERTISLHGGITETSMTGIVKTGGGQLSLSGTLSYTGDTVVDGGKLLPGPSLTSSNIVVNGGGALGAGTSQATGTSVVNHVQLNGGSLSFRVGTTFDALDVTTLEVLSSSSVTLEPTQPVNPGDEFAVVKYGTLTGLGFGGLSANLSNPHYSANLVDDSANQRLLLQVTGADTIVWNGSAVPGGNVWDVNSSSNWKLSSTLPTVTPSNFYDFDIVTFDDTSAIGNVVLTGTLRPATVKVDSNSTDYTFSGSPIAGGASLTKSGSSTLTLASANTFSGPVTITGGRVVAATATSLGTGLTPVTLGNGAEIAYGAGFTTSRGILLTGATAGIEVAESATVSMSTPVSGAAVVTKSGAGKLRFTSYGNAAFGGASIVVNEGALEMAGFSFNTNIGLASITVNSGAELLIPEDAPHALGGAYTTSPVVNLEGGTLKMAREQYFENVNLRGGTVLANGSAPEFRSDYNLNINSLASDTSSLFSGVIFNHVNSAFLFHVEDGVVDEDLVLSDVTFVIGTNPVTKSGAGTLVMSGAYSYTGSTLVQAGVLRLPTESSKSFVIGANGVATNITGDGSAEIDGTFTLDLSGAETVNGNSWTLVGTAAKSFGPNFTITGFSKSDGVHTLEDGDRTWTFREDNGVLSLEAPSSAYDAYEAANHITGAGPEADSDNDGVANGIEFVIGGISDPALASNSLSLLPTVTDLGASIRFSFHLTDAAATIEPAVWSVEYDDDLTGEWTTLTDPENATISVSPDGNGPDGSPWSQVDVVIPKNSIPARFLRLRVTLPTAP